jgi:hypothetical protein
MAKVTVNPNTVETPTQEIVRAANKTGSVKDARGRVIKFRRMMPSLRQRLRAMAGPELSQNGAWLGEAVAAYCVTEIAGEPVITNTLRELEIVLDALDDDGLAALGPAYEAAFGAAGTIDDAKN